MIWRFDRFELDTGALELRDGDRAVPLEPQVFALLALLVENADRAVSKDEIVEKVWDGRAISDTALSSRLKSLRRALGDSGREQRLVRTLHGRGLRFAGEARAVAPATDPAGRAAAPLPARPSIAVLPFELLGTLERWPALPDALPHEILLALSRLHWLFVIARGSSFRLRRCGGGSVDVQEVGRLLGARYCLGGTIEADAPRMTVTVELSDSGDRRVVWTERWSARVEDVHELRERIVARTAAALELTIPQHEAGRAGLGGSEDLDAWAAYHLGLRHMYRFHRHDNAAAAKLFAAAVEKDPGFARAHAGLSFTSFQDAFLGYSRDIASVRRHAERAVELDPSDPFANFTMGRSLWLEGDLDASGPWLERSTTQSPSYAQGIYARGWTDSVSGRGVEGQRHVDLAMALSPLDPLHFAMLGTRSLSHLVRGEDDEAAQWGERAARAPGAHVLIALIALAAHSLAGNGAQAGEWARRARQRRPDVSAQEFFRCFPFPDGAVRRRIAAALAKSGL